MKQDEVLAWELVVGADLMQKVIGCLNSTHLPSFFCRGRASIPTDILRGSIHPLVDYDGRRHDGRQINNIVRVLFVVHT